MKTIHDLKVGDTVWVFDGNRRVYERDDNGRREGGPIWIKHWVSAKVVGETSRSFVVGRGYGEFKLPKNGTRPKLRVAFSEEEVGFYALLERRRAIADMLSRCEDPEVVRGCAQLLGFEFVVDLAGLDRA